MNIQLKMNRAAYGCRLQGFRTVPRCAATMSDVICLLTRINRGVRQRKSHPCQIYTRHVLRERMSGDVSHNKSLEYYMQLTLTNELCCMVSITIPFLVTVKTLIWICSS